MKRRNFIKKGGLGLTGIGLASTGSNAFHPNEKNATREWGHLANLYERPPVTETFSRSDRVRSGIALGGIGTGSVELRKDGNFYNWSIFNNYPLGTGPMFSLPARPNAHLEDSYLFFIVRYQVEGEAPRLKILQLNDSIQEGGMEGIIYYYPWMSGVENIEYAARFPFVNMRFTDAEMPFDIELEAFSPFIPHDVKNSSLPLIYFHFSVHSKISKPVDVTLLGSLRNLVGYDTVQKYFTSEIIQNNDYQFFIHSVGGMDEKSSSFGQMGLGAIGGEEVSHYLGWEHKHPYYEKLLVSKKLSNLDDTGGRNLKTPGGEWIGRMGKLENDQRCFSSVAVTRTLQGGEQFDTTMYMGWYFPNSYGAVHDNLERTHHEPVQNDFENGLSPTKIQGHFYENSFTCLADVAQYGYGQRESLRQRSRHFTEGMYATHIDQFILDQVNSQLNTFITSSTLTKAGKYVIREGITPSKSWGPTATADVSLYASVMILTLFPELQKSMMRLHRNLQGPNGEINHGLGYDPDFTRNGTFGVFHRVDLVPNYIQMVLRDYLWTNDRAYLEEMWPSIKKGIEYVLSETDKDGDQMPDMHGIMCSYDNFPMHGLAAYILSQWIATMQLAAIAARDLHEPELGQQYQAIAEKGKKLMEQQLWNGSYFRLANDYLGGKGKDEGCLTDQLIGQWVAHCAGLGPIFDRSKVRPALQSILDFSFIENKFLRNCTWPEHRELFPIENTNLWVDQANTPWTGVELAFASLLIYEGMVEEGKMVIKGVDDRYRKAGLYWDHQEFGGHYLRPMSAWAILNALSGFALVKGGFAFNPANGAGQYFFATPEGTGHFVCREREKGAVRAHSGSLAIRSLKLPVALFGRGEGTTLFANDTALGNVTWQQEGEQYLRAVFGKPVILREGDTLSWG